MNRISADPRPPINQGIDTNNATVLRHTQIYDALLSHITENIGYVALSVNPYGTAPLSGYLGIWAVNANPIRVQISDDIGSVPVDYNYTPVIGANLVPLVGLAPDAANQVLVTIPGIGTATTSILTNPLPPDDSQIPPDQGGGGDQFFPVFTGFPIYEVTIPAVNPPSTVDELYFSAFLNRYNAGVDHTGRVRWYTTLDMPAFNFIRLRNGNFLGSANNLNDNKLLYQFDMVGRVYAAYVLDNECHHSIYEMPNGNILIPSGDEESSTVEDGLSIIDLSTGLEVAYYDIRNVMDMTRTPRPGNETDWIHINHSYYDETNNLLVTSGRHQGVFGLDADSSELVFILANREGWGEDFQQYLLMPVDDSGNPLYDFSNPDDIDRADKEFWQWGQHSVVEIPNETQGIVELILFDNGNFRSRNDENSLIANDNYSQLAHFLIDLPNMTVRKLFAYGQEEVGRRGYSSFVSNVYIIDNGNYLINFGAPLIDENGRTRTETPGYSDIVDPLIGDQVMARLVLTEIDPSTGEALVEFTISSGRYKNAEDDGPNFVHDVMGFRAFKASIIPQ